MDQMKTILIVDDTEENIDILLGILQGYDVLVALDGASAIQIANEENIDLILLDIMMPEMDGYETCRRLKKNSSTKEIPVVFITAKTDEDSIEQAYDTGGVDYVTKPFKPKELLARVKTQLELRSLICHFEQLSSFDPMTGIYNRRKFFELGELSFQSPEGLFAIMLDIDKFKIINDTYGHPVGDRVIKAVASAMGEQVPERAIFGRLGGEEFAVLCHFDDADVAMATTERMRESVSRLNVDDGMGTIIGFTISGGLALYNSNHATLDQLLKQADDALYDAKGAGRNKAIFRS